MNHLELVPLHTVVIARVLIVLEVAENAGFDSYVEVIGLVRSNRHKACAHYKAVHLSTNRAVHIGNLMSVEVVTS